MSVPAGSPRARTPLLGGAEHAALGVLRCGWILKLGKWHVDEKRRYLVLSHASLHCFRREEDDQLFGVETRAIELSRVSEVREGGEPTLFDLVTPQRTWTFRADTAEDCRKWVAAIQKARAAPQPQRRGTLSGSFFADSSFTPVVEMVSVAHEGASEVVVARAPVVDGAAAALDLGALRRGARVLMTLNGGGRISFGLDAITHAKGKPFWVSAEDTPEPTRLQVAVKAAAAPAAAPQQQQQQQGKKKKEPSALVSLLHHPASSAGLALSFLASAVWYRREPAVATVTTLGCLLAVQVLLMSATRPADKPAAPRQDAQPPAPAGRRYTLSLLEFHVAEDDSEAEDEEAANAELAAAAPTEPQVNEAFERFVRGCFGDRDEAQRRWDITQAWRAEENVDAILDEPQPYYTIIKKYYPHYVHGFDKLGHPVYFERPGFVDLKALKRSGVGLQQLLRHYLFITENLWNNIAPSEEARTMTVLDVTGIGIRDLAGDVFEFIRGASHFVQEHYPERSFKIVIINVPGWFNMIWKMIKPLINDVTRQKISIMGSSGYQELLLELIDPENLPREYGGTCNCGGPGGECRFGSKEERDQAELVAQITPEPVVEG